MPPLPSSPDAPSQGAELENSLAAVEQRLAALGEALRERNAEAIELHATELHRALADAVNRFAQAARTGGVPPVLRRRLANASGQVAAQRESLARATAALDRAIDVLMPAPPAGGVYSPQGGTERASLGGVIQA
ncbi:hypothetical protein [Ideonella sp. BN130291]|uniref:hypothetical protein n=1 Tax=Ideonella sp. BN130291 TaxID=3112940 RepID=UPI002E25D328|nr:hypothetical protein [Ideonella sp. BN130291]